MKITEDTEHLLRGEYTTIRRKIFCYYEVLATYCHALFDDREKGKESLLCFEGLEDGKSTHNGFTKFTI